MQHSHIQEHSLIDRYVRGTLPLEERAAFEEHFLDCPECLEQLEIASSLRDAIRISAADMASSGAGALARGPTPWSGLLKLLPNMRLTNRSRTGASGAVQGDRPTALFAWRWAAVIAAACFIVTLMPAIVLYRQLQYTRSDLAGKQLAFARELQDAKRAFEGAQQAPPAIYVLNQARGGNEAARNIGIPTSPRWIVFSVEMDLSQAPKLGASLTDNSGKVIWHNEDIQPSSSDAIAIAVPSTVFTPGDFTLALVQPGPGAGGVPLARFFLHAK